MTSRRHLLASAATAGVAPHLLAQTIPEVWDVIVVGAGLAGLRSAVAAYSAGARKILILEKGPLIGGHSLYSSGTIAAVAPWRAHDTEGFQDSVDQFVEDAMKIGGNRGDPERLRAIAEGSAFELDWLETLGVFFGEPFTAASGLQPRCFSRPGNLAGRSYAIAAAGAVTDLKIPIRMNTRAAHLLHAGKLWHLTVTSMTSVTPKPATLSSKSVVIATGGYSANIPLRCLDDPRLTVDIRTTANPQGTVWDGADGDGLLLAREVGAQITKGNGVQTMPYSGGRLLDYAGADIYITDDGVRFIDETRPWSEITNAILALPERHFWVITDARSFKGGTLGLKLINRIVRKSPTIEAMAEGMNISASVLEKTIRDYNVAVLDGRDLVTGKTQFAQTIDTPPYYWGRETIYVHTTLDGILTNKNSEVLDAKGAPLPGLYAAGEVAGGIFGRDRLSGGSLTNCLVLGRIAGTEAAAHALRI